MVLISVVPVGVEVSSALVRFGVSERFADSPIDPSASTDFCTEGLISTSSFGLGSKNVFEQILNNSLDFEPIPSLISGLNSKFRYAPLCVLTEVWLAKISFHNHFCVESYRRKTLRGGGGGGESGQPS